MVVTIILLFEVYSLDIKRNGDSRLWLWLWLWFGLYVLQLFLPSSVGSALIKAVALSATIPAFPFVCLWKIEKIYLIFSTISEAAQTEALAGVTLWSSRRFRYRSL